MLRFNGGSMVGLNLLMSYFNTSYVTVQRAKVHTNEYSYEFQYILCYGSTNFFQVISLIKVINFNTSYVTVQQ